MKSKIFALTCMAMVLTSCSIFSSLSDSGSSHRYQDGVYSSYSNRLQTRQERARAKTREVRYFPSASMLKFKHSKNNSYTYYNDCYTEADLYYAYNRGYSDGWSGWGYDPYWDRSFGPRWYPYGPYWDPFWDPFWYRGPYGPYYPGWGPYYPGWGPYYPYRPGWGPWYPYRPVVRPVIGPPVYRVPAHQSSSHGRHQDGYRPSHTTTSSNGVSTTISTGGGRIYGPGIGYRVRPGGSTSSGGTGTTRSGSTSGSTTTNRFRSSSTSTGNGYGSSNGFTKSGSESSTGSSYRSSGSNYNSGSSYRSSGGGYSGGSSHSSGGYSGGGGGGSRGRH